MRTHLLFILASLSVPLCLCSESALAQDLTPRSTAQDKPVVIINATIHPISSPAIEKGFVLFDRGVITGVGAIDTLDSRKVDPTWRVIDAKGKHVYPGLIGASTQLGLTEMQSVRASSDFAETGGVTPEVRAVSAVNPDSTLLPVTRSAGELIAGVFPSGGTIPGRAGVIRLDGWTVADMTIRDQAGLVVNWPVTRTINAPWMNQSEDEQRRGMDRTQKLIEEMITGAKAYAAAAGGSPKQPVDIRFEAMRAIFGGSSLSPETHDPKPDTRLPLFIHAQDYDQIQQAVTLCTKHGLACVIVGGRDAPLCADLLKRHSVPVIVDGTFKFPKRDDAPYDDAFTLPARLHAAGITFCIASGEETAHERNLSNAAGMAVAYGLDHERGLRAITLSSAEVLGIADRYGSLATEKSATMIVTDGDVLDVLSHVTMAFLDGREVNLSNKQKVLEERYRGKYQLK
jgi:imidazolonepropionase-like amidohydrolase